MAIRAQASKGQLLDSVTRCDPPCIGVEVFVEGSH